MLGFLAALMPWKAISNIELLWSNKSLCDDLVLQSTVTVTNIYRRDYALSVDAIQKQLPSRNAVSLALNRWASPNKLRIMSVIAYHMDRNWALGDIQLASYEVDHLFFSRFKSQLWMIGQGPT